MKLTKKRLNGWYSEGIMSWNIYLWCWECNGESEELLIIMEGNQMNSQREHFN